MQLVLSHHHHQSSPAILYMLTQSTEAALCCACKIFGLVSHFANAPIPILAGTTLTTRFDFSDNAKRGGKDEEDDVDVVMLPGPSGSKDKSKSTKPPASIQFKEEQLDLPADVLASQKETPRDWSR